jgi:hypothetical protein
MTQSSEAERAKKEGMPISQVLYLGLVVRCRASPSAFISGPRLPEAVD